MRKFMIAIMLAIASLGCDKLPNSKKQDAIPIVSTSTADEAIVNAFKGVSKEDAIILRKMYVGMEQYLTHGKKITNTAQVLKTLQAFEDDFGYDKTKYPEVNAAVKKYFNDKNYNKIKTIVDNESDVKPAVDGQVKQVLRSVIVADIKVLADAAKVAMNAKL